MGTTLTVSVEAPTRAQALAASEAAARAVESCEARLSTWRDDSELALLNRHPVDRPFELSPALRAELSRAHQIWAWTDGAFDPSLGGAIAAWGLRSGGRVPASDELQQALVTDGFAALELAGDSAVRRDGRLQVEEGGFGKGAGLDAAVAALEHTAATRATVDLGGQLVLFGELARPVTIGVADPDDREREVAHVSIDGGSIATSGNSERAIEVDGKRHSHLLDPRTGRPCDDFGSLTVWAPDALTADALSTALYVMGPDRALAWAERNEGVEVLALVRSSDGIDVRATSGWAPTIEARDTPRVMQRGLRSAAND